MGRRPALFITQCLTNSAGFAPRSGLYHQSLGPATNTAAPATFPNQDFCLAIEQGNVVRGADAGFFGSTAPDATNITLGENAPFNADSRTAGAPATVTYQCYAWAEIEGYSKFGRYAANGPSQSADFDGPFIYCGFKPAMVWFKGCGAAESWIVLDTTRDVSNPVGMTLRQNAVGNELDLRSQQPFDILSNGFKIRTGEGQLNFINSGYYIYCAWAENPFGGNNVSPANAR